VCDCHSPEAHNTGDCLHDGGADSSSKLRRFHKLDLRNAQVINQVDRKFIACLIDQAGNSESSGCNCDHAVSRALVLIDQHAADERVRVERFLKELCSGFLRHERGTRGGVPTKELSPPLPVLLTRHEALRLKSSIEVRQAFESWGFRFGDFSHVTLDDPEEGTDNGCTGYAQVSVCSIPEVVGDKLLVGDELRELVKGFLANLESDASTFSLQRPLEDSSVDQDEYPWLKALRWCPRELLDLVNSKACRGAIMFNDSLTVVQCERLVRQLSETAFPFQCAHGRPSLVPLVNVNLGNQEERNNERRHGAKVQWTKLAR